jgi:CRP/FNR family transcriptional regulator, cyclic AMP receptor protein
MTDMATEDLARIIKEHPFFAGLGERFCNLICDCAAHTQFDAGAYLFHEGEPANRFYLLRHGSVALEIKAPQRGALVIQTLRAGEILGVSWLVPPYRWAFDAKAIELTRVIGVDAACLRQKCDEDHDFGYEIMQRFVPVLMKRLQATRLQLLDVYGRPT